MARSRAGLEADEAVCIICYSVDSLVWCLVRGVGGAVVAVVVRLGIP